MGRLKSSPEFPDSLQQLLSDFYPLSFSLLNRPTPGKLRTQRGKQKSLLRIKNLQRRQIRVREARRKVAEEVARVGPRAIHQHLRFFWTFAWCTVTFFLPLFSHLLISGSFFQGWTWLGLFWFGPPHGSSSRPSTLTLL